MSVGRPSAYPRPIREAFLAAVFEEGLPYTRVAGELRAGTFKDFGKVPVSNSTARGWRDKYLRDTAAQTEPDETAWRAIADDSLRVLTREMEKLTRDARKPKPLDPKRLREMLGAVKDARPLVAPKTATDPEATPGSPDQTEPESMLDRLAREEQAERSTATSEPPNHPTPNTETAPAAQRAEQTSTDTEDQEPSPVLTRTSATQPAVALAATT